MPHSPCHPAPHLPAHTQPHTRSLSAPGCLPVSSTMAAAPFIVCAASFSATSRGSPARTPPSARASIMRKP
eukprot:scaffold7863_cov118-Isochrysis_galbana.AAC.7